MRKEIIIGILTIVTFLAGLWGFNFIKGSNMLKRNLEFHSYYSDVAELATGSAVTVSGFKVGSITKIELDPTDVSRVKVSYEVEKDIKVPASARAVLRNTSFMGGRGIELQFKKLCGGDLPCATSGSELNGNELGMIGSMIDFSEADPLVETVGKSVDVITDKLSGDTTSQIYSTYQNLDATIENLTKVTKQLSNIMYANNQSIESTLSSFAAISKNLEQNNQQINSILSNLSRASNDFASLNLNQTVSQANGTLSSTEAAITELKGVAAKASTSMQQLDEIIAKVNNEEGSLGKLINDKELYENVEGTAEHLALLLQDLRLNPKRYVNLSVFGKKQAYVHPDDDPAAK